MLTKLVDQIACLNCSGEGRKLSSPFLYLKMRVYRSRSEDAAGKNEIQERGKIEKSDKKNDGGHAGGGGDVWNLDGELSGSPGG